MDKKKMKERKVHRTSRGEQSPEWATEVRVRVINFSLGERERQ